MRRRPERMLNGPVGELGDGSTPEGQFPGHPGDLFVSRSPVALWQKQTGSGDTGWGLATGTGPSAFVALTVDFAAAITVPVYVVLLTLQLTTVSASSQLYFMYTGNWRHTGGFAGNAAFNARFRLDGALLPGTTDNKVRNQLGSVSRQGRVAVTAGLHTLDVEVSKFGAVGNTIIIDPVTNPDLNHATLFMQEQAG